MATWHQSKNRSGMAALYTPPVKGYRVVIDPPGGFACAVEFTNKRKAQAYVRKCGGMIIAAKRRN